MKTTVIHIRNKTGDSNEVYIGRGGTLDLGNPIARGRDCPVCGMVHHDNGSTLPCYKQYLSDRLITDAPFKELVKSLQGKTLMCFCKPNPCHGDVLVEATELLNA